MRFSILTAFTLFAAGSLAAPAATSSADTCSQPLQRKEWRQLSTLEQANYVLSVKCMMVRTGKLQSSISGAVTRYDDFTAEHQRVTPYTHYVGHFLPWHRLFLHAYEKALRDECFYFGALPYWDYSLDFQDFPNAPVFTGTINFGGNGAVDPDAVQNFNTTRGGCIESGLFKNSRTHVGHLADGSYTSRCIKRNLAAIPGLVWLNPGREQEVLAQPVYQAMAVKLEGNMDFYVDLGIHSAGHLGVGGDMMDMFTSPSDPVFYLHHANIDRIWAKWQAANPSARTFATGNPIRPRINQIPFVDSPALDGVVTPAMPLNLGDLGYDYTVAQVGDTLGTAPEGFARGPLCYQYV